MSNTPDIGEQAMNKIAEVAIKTQLDEVDELAVDVELSPQALTDGTVESVTIDGRGLSMQDNVRTEALHIETGPISINPWKAAFGNIEFKQTVEAQVEIMLTEQDINRALNSEMNQQKLQAQKINVEGQPTALNPGHIQLQLFDDGTAKLSADIELTDLGQQQKVRLTLIPAIGSQTHHIVLEQVTNEADADASDDLNAVMLDNIRELLDIRNFALEGMALQLCHLTVQSNQMELTAQAMVEEFPGD